MEIKDVLTNNFQLRYDENTERILLYSEKDGSLSEFPIELRLSTLMEMGPEGASKWLGETVLLLIPEMRQKLFKLKE